MRYAEAGYNLEIDLATGNVERVETDPKLTELYLGGLGTSVKMHWDRVPPETKPFDPENLLIFSNGLLCGTPALSANRTLVSFISPQTELLAYPMMGGFFAAELKYAGYDKVILRNKSPKLVYVWIYNDKVEIRDAAHLQKKGALETQELIREELKEPNVQIAFFDPVAISIGNAVIAATAKEMSMKLVTRFFSDSPPTGICDLVCEPVLKKSMDLLGNSEYFHLYLIVLGG